MKTHKSVKDIPANTLVVMTKDLFIEFCQGGCMPMCHLTLEDISIGEEFQLATLRTAIKRGSNNFNAIETRDVMLAKGSSPEDYEKRSQKLVEAERMRRQNGGGCFRVNGKIVH